MVDDWAARGGIYEFELFRVPAELSPFLAAPFPSAVAIVARAAVVHVQLVRLSLSASAYVLLPILIYK